MHIKIFTSYEALESKSNYNSNSTEVWLPSDLANLEHGGATGHGGGPQHGNGPRTSCGFSLNFASASSFSPKNWIDLDKSW